VSDQIRLHSPELLRMAERSERIDEADLRIARAQSRKNVTEFDIGGRITQINPVQWSHL